MGLREAPEHQRSARIRVQRKTIHREPKIISAETSRDGPANCFYPFGLRNMKCPVGQISNKSEKSDKKKLKDLNKFERFLRRAKRVELDYSDDSRTQKN